MMEQQTLPRPLTLALPKQKKLQTPIMEVLNSKGFVLLNSKGFVLQEHEDEETGLLVNEGNNIPNIRIEFVRAADALVLLSEKVADIAMIGSDVVDERTSGDNPREKPEQIFDLDTAKCTFVLAVPKQSSQKYTTEADLNGSRIATSNPNLLKAWLNKNNVEGVKIIERDGGVESSVRMGFADVVADLKATGDTLEKNGLTVAFEISKTSAICCARKNIDPMTSLRITEFLRELRGQRQLAAA